LNPRFSGVHDLRKSTLSKGKKREIILGGERGEVDFRNHGLCQRGEPRLPLWLISPVYYYNGRARGGGYSSERLRQRVEWFTRGREETQPHLCRVNVAPGFKKTKKRTLLIRRTKRNSKGARCKGPGGCPQRESAKRDLRGKRNQLS